MDFENEMNKPFKSIGSEHKCAIELHHVRDVNSFGNACAEVQLIRCIFRKLTQLFKDPTPRGEIHYGRTLSLTVNKSSTGQLSLLGGLNQSCFLEVTVVVRVSRINGQFAIDQRFNTRANVS